MADDVRARFPLGDKKLSQIRLEDFGPKSQTGPTSPTTPTTPYDEEKGGTRFVSDKTGLGAVWDSFREMPPTRDGKQTDYLARTLKGRHLQMIAIGGAIGTGLFVGSGSALSEGGPASLILAYSIIGAMLFCTIHALGELAVLFPVAGSFAVYGTRFVDPAWGFAMGWNYALSWLATIPLEITAASLTIGYWPGAAHINPAAWVSIFLVAIVTINLFGARGYGEAEFAFSMVKIVAIIGFIILSVIINIGGGPDGGYVGGRYWHHPGAFHNGFKGLCSTFVTASFSFAGAELVGLGSAETANPRKTLPPAIKQVFWRIVIFYLVSLTLIGLNVPYNNPRLLDASNSADATASPFVISIENAGLATLPSVFNAVILISVLSVGNSSIYGSSRTLAALAEQGQAPRIMGYIDRAGRPLVAIAFSSLWGLIAFIAAAGDNARNTALDWLIAISGLSLIFTWGSICLCHIRFRKAWALNGHTLDELAFRSMPGVVGSWIGLIINGVVLMAQFWTGAWPTGYSSLSPDGQAYDFFEAFLSVPIVIAFYVGYKIWKKTSIVKTKDMDIRTGRREMDITKLLAEERAEQMTWPRWKRAYKLLC